MGRRVACSEAGISPLPAPGRSRCDIGFLFQEVLDFIVSLSSYYKFSYIDYMRDLNFLEGTMGPKVNKRNLPLL